MVVSAPVSFNILTHLRTCTKATLGIPIASTKIFCREYKPYSKTPKKFLQKTENARDRANCDDVYLLKYQDLPLHTAQDAIDMARAYALFQPEEVRLILQVNIGENRSNLRNRDGIIFFPHPMPAHDAKVMVLADGDKAEEARQAGAALVGGSELLEGLEEGKVKHIRDYTLCITTPDFYPQMKHLGKHMRAIFPHPRRGTVTNDITEAVQRSRSAYSFKLKGNKWATLKLLIGTTDSTREEMQENFDAILQAVHKLKNANVDNAMYYRRAYISAESMRKALLDVKDFDP